MASNTPPSKMSKRELSITYHDNDIEIKRVLPFICAGNSDQQADNWRELLEESIEPDLLKILRDRVMKDLDDDTPIFQIADAIDQSGLTGFLVEYSIPNINKVTKMDGGRRMIDSSRGSVQLHWIYVEELTLAGQAEIAAAALQIRESEIARVEAKPATAKLGSRK